MSLHPTILLPPTSIIQLPLPFFQSIVNHSLQVQQQYNTTVLLSLQYLHGKRSGFEERAFEDISQQQQPTTSGGGLKTSSLSLETAGHILHPYNTIYQYKYIVVGVTSTCFSLVLNCWQQQRTTVEVDVSATAASTYVVKELEKSAREGAHREQQQDERERPFVILCVCMRVVCSL